MKEILKGKQFCVILVILLLAVFVYPPFIVRVSTAEHNVTLDRSWGWFFSPPKYSCLIMELDFKMIVGESIMAFLLAIGICLILFKKNGGTLILPFKRKWIQVLRVILVLIWSVTIVVILGYVIQFIVDFN